MNMRFSPPVSGIVGKLSALFGRGGDDEGDNLAIDVDDEGKIAVSGKMCRHQQYHLLWFGNLVGFQIQEEASFLQNSLSCVFIHEMSNQSFVNTTHPIRQPLHFVWNLQQALSNGCQRDVVHIRRQESEIQRMYPMRNVLKRMP